jgi:RHH-type proline utilization regulon transcriptional repressor/proline dehydrogenase/delta 1-pyrroline-5-carboxylate dehydrogenase
MESVESSLRGWHKPTYPNKRLVDANYKRLLEFGCQLNNASAVRLGIASHNPFDIAYGALLRARHVSEASVGFELLQGMADPFCRALAQVLHDVLVYAPMVTERDFTW